jgi:outer membrane murein-binding lipoprotein Lpp
MLRINLLPAYLGEAKKRTTQYVLAGLLFVVTAGAMAGWFVKQKGETDAMTTAAQKMDERATAVETLKSNTDTLEATIKPLKDKVNFVKQVRWYNGLRPRVFEQAARYTDPRVEYMSMGVSGDTLSIKGRVKKLEDAASYYLAMSANPDVKAVGWKGIYGWPNSRTNQTTGPGQEADPNASGFDIDVVAQLTSSVTAPAPPGGGSSVGGGGAGGGMPGGMSGGGPPGMPMGGYGGGGGGMSGGAPGNSGGMSGGGGKMGPVGASG